jgi:hypothetical protein
MMPSVFARGDDVVVGYVPLLLAAIYGVCRWNMTDSADVRFLSDLLGGHLGFWACAVAQCGIVLISDFLHWQDYHVRGEDCFRLIALLDSLSLRSLLLTAEHKSRVFGRDDMPSGCSSCLSVRCANFFFQTRKKKYFTSNRPEAGCS